VASLKSRPDRLNASRKRPHLMSKAAFIAIDRLERGEAVEYEVIPL
jgi:hypothetical protein